MAGNPMQSNKKILLFTPGFAADEQDDSCIPPLQAFALMLKRYAEVEILTLHYPFEQKTYLWKGIKVHALGGANCSYPGRLYYWKRAWQALKMIHKSFPFNILHSFWLHECALIGSYFSRIYKIPHCVTLMGQDVLPGNYFRHFIFIRQAVCLSVRQKIHFEKQYNRAKAFQVIPFGVEREIVQQLLPVHFDIIGAASLIPLKQWPLFLETVSLIKDHFPELRVLVIGDGVLRKEIGQWALRLNLRGNVYLAGHLPRHKVLKKMASGRILLHTSSYESQGYVFNEALASGMCIVSTPVGISKEQVYWKIGSSKETLAEHCIAFLDQTPNREMRQPFLIDKTVTQYLHLYDNINANQTQ